MKITATVLFLILLTPLLATGQTSWKGTTSTDWSKASNWTNGVPTASVDATIGDANFTGANQPRLTAAASYCKSLTLGTGIKASTLTIAKALIVSGNITIGANGTINHSGKNVLLTGNWSNSGAYSASASATVICGGTAQSISGATSFRSLTTNAGSTVTLNTNISIAHQLTVNGTVDPGDSPTYTVSGSGNVIVGRSGKIFVKASTFAGNYNLSFNLNSASTVEYSSSTINQTVSSAPAYGNLTISGSLTKTLGGNLSGLGGNLTIVAGTLDLSTFTADRGAPGGALTLANGATLKIGGTNTFPANYATRSLGVTSTVMYSGTNQAVSTQAYGNLTLTASGGSVTKTMQSAPMTISGNFSTTIGSGTSVSFTAAGAITVGGDVSIGASTTFNGSTFAHTFAGNLTNNGTFTGSTGTVTLSGINKSISGAGTTAFNNLTVTGSGVSLSPTTNVTVSGNLTTSGAGTFSQTGGGTVTMTGAGKAVSGTGIVLNNVTVSGSVTSGSSFTIAGDFSVGGSFSASSGTVTLNGASKTIGGAGTLSFNALNVPGTISTAKSFTMKSDLSVSGSLTASAGTLTFNGTSTLSGAPSLFNITLNGTKLQLGTSSVLGIGGALTITSGTFDVTTSTPNTVDYNAPGAQSITQTTYHNLSLSNSGLKIAGGSLTVNGDLTINSGVTFNGGSVSHSFYGNWINNGTFVPGASTIQFVGGSDASISGTTSFGSLALNKNSTANLLVLQSSVTVATLVMTKGIMQTGSDSITITSGRSGPGSIIGTIVRTHAFSDGASYPFESPNNAITFANGASGVSSITVHVTRNTVQDFVFASAINREYDITVASGGSYQATLRLHYQDNELNGNGESLIQLWTYGGVTWAPSGKTANDTVDNWVEQGGLASVAGRWSLSDNQNVVSWNGSVSSAWEDSANWSTVAGLPAVPPGIYTIVLLGDEAFTNQPAISSAVTVKNMLFKSVKAATLTIGAGGSLVSIGNITGQWAAGAAHTIDVGAQTLTAGGNLTLSDNTIGNSINLSIGSGSVAVGGSINQSGDAGISWNGPGSLNLGGDFNYTGGTFSGGSGMMVYNGSESQVVGGVTYNNLNVGKSDGTATLSSSAAVGGNLTLSSGGALRLNAPLTVSGNVTVNSPASLLAGSASLSVGGNWNRSGAFNAGTGAVVLNGSSAQSIGASTFNNLVVNKSGGTASPSGDLAINGDLSVMAGTLDLLTFAANRSSVGGTLTIGASGLLKIGGSLAFPINYESFAVDPLSTVEYYGTPTQIVAAVPYGNLSFSNGGSNVKILSGPITVSGNLLINSGASFDAGSFAATINGNWTNSGTFVPSASSVNLAGSSKMLTGATTFHDLEVSGDYTAASDVIVNGSANILGSYQAGSSATTFSGNFLNSGSFASSGAVSFTGGSAQTLSLNSGFNSLGNVNFNGTVSPTFNEANPPSLTDVHVNNAGGVSPDIGWTIDGAFVVGNGAVFDGLSFTHAFGGSFTNNGTVNSAGTLVFNPSSSTSVTLLGTAFTSTGTVNFGGSGDITIVGAGANLSSVIVANTSLAGVTPLSNLAISGDILISDGSTFNGGSGLTHTLTGNWTNSGLFNGGTSTVNMNSPLGSSIGGDGNTIFTNLVISGTVTAASPFYVAGDFTDNGTFDATGVAVSFTGSTPSLISGSTAPVPFDLLTVSKAAATATLGVNVTGLSGLTVSSGTLDLATFSVTQNALGGVLTLNGGAALKIGGSNTLPAFDQYIFDVTSTVEYNGNGSQTVRSGVTYGNLTISNSGTKTAGGGLAVGGNLSISGGTFVGGGYTDTVGGNWNMTGGTFTNAGTTVAFTGSGDQTVGSTGDFNNLVVNKPSGSCNLRTNIAVDGTLIFTLGNLVTSSDTVIIGASGSVLRTSGHVFGNLQKQIPLGAPSATFEVGDAGTYAPVNVAFAIVSAPGSLTASTSGGDHPNLLTSGIDPTVDVNRYWSLRNKGIGFTTCAATFNYAPSDVDGGADPNAFIAQKYDAPIWSQPAVGVRTGTSTQVVGLTSFSDFAFGGIETDTIFASASAHGTISPSGSIPLLYDRDTSFTISADAHYHIDSVLVDGISVGAVTNYTVSHIATNHTIDARISIDTYTIMATAGAGGTITPSGTPAVGYGDSLMLVIAPNPGHFIADVIVDSASVGPVASYTFHNVVANHTISALFGVSNTPPAAARLVSPANGDSVLIDEALGPITFRWNASADVDLDTVLYSVHIVGLNVDTVFSGMSDTSLIVQMTGFQFNAPYTWTVGASDGHSTVASPDTFTFYLEFTTGVKDLKGIPQDYALHQNYPNPFNPTTDIQFDLPKSATVTLAVYNILGQEVAVLVNKQFMDAGYKSFTFDASSIPSGAYLYRIFAQEANGNAFVNVKKMILAK